MKKTILLSFFAVFTLSVMAQSKVTMVPDRSGSGNYFAKLCPTSDVGINKDDVKSVFCIYLDRGVAHFCKMRIQDCMYIVKAGECVVIYTKELKEVDLVDVYDEDDPYDSSIWGNEDNPNLYRELFTLNADQPLDNFRKEKDLKDNQYVYRLTNNAASGGFGFTYFTGKTMKAGQFFIISTLKPTANGRLAVKWLDENGQEIPELQTTGIQNNIDAASSDDNAVYTLQGTRVTAPQKGQLYIRNGRKYFNN